MLKLKVTEDYWEIAFRNLTTSQKQKAEKQNQ